MEWLAYLPLVGGGGVSNILAKGVMKTFNRLSLLMPINESYTYILL